MAFINFAVGLPGTPSSAAASRASRLITSSLRGSMEKSVVRGCGASAMDSVMVIGAPGSRGPEGG